jgi:hypothetical protein
VTRHLHALLIFAASTVAGTTGCLGPDSIGPASQPLSAVSPPVLGSLQSRDRVVAFRGGPDGPRFDVQTRDGQLIAADLTLEQVTAQHPELGRALRGFAVEGVEQRAGEGRAQHTGPIGKTGPVTDRDGRALLLAD